MLIVKSGGNSAGLQIARNCFSNQTDRYGPQGGLEKNYFKKGSWSRLRLKVFESAVGSFFLVHRLSRTPWMWLVVCFSSGNGGWDVIE